MKNITGMENNAGNDINVGNNDSSMVTTIAIAMIIGVIALGAFSLGGKFLFQTPDETIQIESKP